MSGVLLPPGGPPPTAVPSAQGAGLQGPSAQGIATGTLIDPSAALIRLATGTILAGTVIGRDAAGRVTIKTDLGLLSLAINAQLPPDSRVSLEIRVAGSRLHAILLAVEIQPEAAARIAASPTPPVRGAPAPALPPTTATAGGHIVTAIVIQPTGLLPEMPEPTSASPAPLGPARAEGQPAVPPSAATGPGPQSATLPPPTGADPRAGPPPPPLTVGTEIRLRVVEIIPSTASVPVPPGSMPAAASPNAPTAVAPGSAPGPVVVGTVEAVTPAGNPVVRTPQGVLVLGIKTPLPIGSQVAIEIVAASPPPGPALVPADPLRRLALSQDWSALDETVAALGRHEPGHAPPPLPLPQVGPRLAAGLLNFLAAFGGGDFESWFGSAIQDPLERAGHADLAGRARQELSQIAQLATDSAGDEWRLLLLPLVSEAGLQKAKLYLRRRGRGDGSGDRDETGTRFILEVELSRLGALQLDGLMQTRRFDLMLRSRIPLTARMQRDITDIFDEARAIGGFAGTMAFATTASLPIVPLDRARRDGGSVVV